MNCSTLILNCTPLNLIRNLCGQAMIDILIYLTTHSPHAVINKENIYMYSWCDSIILTTSPAFLEKKNIQDTTYAYPYIVPRMYIKTHLHGRFLWRFFSF